MIRRIEGCAGVGKFAASGTQEVTVWERIDRVILDIHSSVLIRLTHTPTKSGSHEKLA